jgi:hypothetical protein
MREVPKNKKVEIPGMIIFANTSVSGPHPADDQPSTQTANG